MWIISKSRGLFNVPNLTIITEENGSTYAWTGSARFLISESAVLSTITEAIKRGYPFLEVE